MAAPFVGPKLRCGRFWLWAMCLATVSASDDIVIRNISQLLEQLASGEDVSLLLSGQIDLNGTALHISGDRRVNVSSIDNDESNATLHAQRASRVFEVRHGPHAKARATMSATETG